jgi:CMP-N,N'-diacetyllegionaminic acid synthase
MMLKNRNLSNLAIIPARGGSKRLKNKNKLQLSGKPLVLHTVEAALKSQYVTDVLVSSDSNEILDIACKDDKVSRHKRENFLATDTSTALELVDHIVTNSTRRYDFVTLMLPTCPLRTHEHLDQAFDLISEHDDGVVSVTSYNFPIELNVPVKGDYINLHDNSPLITGNTRSQNHEPKFRPNGGFYVARWDSFKENRNFWKGNVKYFIMSTLDSVDIDTKFDLDSAELLIKEKGNE